MKILCYQKLLETQHIHVSQLWSFNDFIQQNEDEKIFSDTFLFCFNFGAEKQDRNQELKK